MHSANRKILLIFNGSSRIKGNTNLLCKMVAKGAREAGFKVKIIMLSQMRILPCRGCFKCKNGRCIKNRDDGNLILELMEKADAFIFATPVYFWNVSGTMKMFFDRLLPLLTMKKEGGKLKFESKIKGKRAGCIIVQEEEPSGHDSIPIIFFSRNFKDFGLENAGELVVYGVLAEGDVKNKPEELERARIFGLKVCAPQTS